MEFWKKQKTTYMLKLVNKKIIGMKGKNPYTHFLNNLYIHHCLISLGMNSVPECWLNLRILFFAYRWILKRRNSSFLMNTHISTCWSPPPSKHNAHTTLSWMMQESNQLYISDFQCQLDMRASIGETEKNSRI